MLIRSIDRSKPRLGFVSLLLYISSRLEIKFSCVFYTLCLSSQDICLAKFLYFNSFARFQENFLLYSKLITSDFSRDPRHLLIPPKFVNIYASPSFALIHLNKYGSSFFSAV